MYSGKVGVNFRRNAKSVKFVKPVGTGKMIFPQFCVFQSAVVQFIDHKSKVRDLNYSDDIKVLSNV